MRRKIDMDNMGGELDPAERRPDADEAADATTETFDGSAVEGANSCPAGPDTVEDGNTSGVIETLRLRVAELEALAGAEHDKYLRTMAEFQNFRRRMEDEKRSFAQFANEEFVRNLLPVLDNFERALTAAEKNQSFDSLVGGVVLTRRQMEDLLKKNGVEPIVTKDAFFDPNYHEAVDRVADSGLPENSIVQELQRGYVMNSRVLRPSLVRVAGD